jgi:outer membrane protein OmpA-like peptidoglycan-associated protein
MIRTLFLLIILPLLAACADLSLTADVPVHTEFSRTLDSEYINLADYHDTVQHDSKLAGYFRAKAEKARNGKPPLPDNPEDAKLSGPIKEEVDRSYKTLMASLETGEWIENGPMVALAQTRFDCWLALEATMKQGDSGYGCRSKFEEAMDMVAQARPVPGAASFAVYFLPNSIGINMEGMESIRMAARSVRAQPDWLAVLSGYTDLTENQENSRNLSMRRSVSVRNALLQQGVPPESIRVDAFGKAPEGQAGNPDSERRVTIQVMSRPDADLLPPSHIQDLLPENFGKAQAIF